METGIGAAIALSIAKTGASVALLDLTVPILAEILAPCEVSGVQVQSYACDVTNQENVQKVFENIEKDLGPIE